VDDIWVNIQRKLVAKIISFSRHYFEFSLINNFEVQHNKTHHFFHIHDNPNCLLFIQVVCFPLCQHILLEKQIDTNTLHLLTRSHHVTIGSLYYLANSILEVVFNSTSYGLNSRRLTAAFLPTPCVFKLAILHSLLLFNCINLFVMLRICDMTGYYSISLY